MEKVLIFGGTSEGRLLAETLQEAGIFCCVHVATEYGEQVMQKDDGVEIKVGRLSEEDMEKAMCTKEYLAVVDATHPFAKEVTENVSKAARKCEIPYFRLLREESMEEGFGHCTYFESVDECAHALKTMPGKLLLTTGSKDLAKFCADDEVRRRLIVRVLPGMESLKICYDNGLVGEQIIAMQGPYSTELNLALMKQFDISCLVTKESGKNGGVDEKIEAARLLGIPCFVIRRPKETIEKTYSFRETVSAIERLVGRNIEVGRMPGMGKMKVYLAGIGMGDEKVQTMQVQEVILGSDYLFGAPRMISRFPAKKEKYPYYLAEDILPKLEEIKKDSKEDCIVTILFSGDTGFYSGTAKIMEKLKSADYEVEILPGISTVSMLSAKVGIPWQDAKIISCHGIKEELWKSNLVHALRRENKIFFLTSGVGDLHKIGELLAKEEFLDEFSIYVGYNLSYEDESVEELTEDACMKLEKEGLYAGFLVRKKETDGEKSHGNAVDNNGFLKKYALMPGLSDGRFIRGEVPMTKEEVRVLSLSKLHLQEKSVFYDIGAGTGSISIEVGLLHPSIEVYAIETKEEAVDLIKQNVENNLLSNVKIMKAMAPDGLLSLPKATHAFIGGNRGNLTEILDCLYTINPSMRVVMNAVSMESIAAMQKALGEYPVCEEEMVQVNISKGKKVGAYHMMQANNPVMIFAFRFKEKETL